MRFACAFLNMSIMSFPKYVTMTKYTPFFPILSVFAPLNDVRAYIAWSCKTSLITWIFLREWYPTSNTSRPPPRLNIVYHSEKIPRHNQRKRSSIFCYLHDEYVTEYEWRCLTIQLIIIYHIVILFLLKEIILWHLNIFFFCATFQKTCQPFVALISCA